jgi:AAA+ superfamily predicted ATPase
MADFPILDTLIRERLADLPPQAGTANPLYVTEEEVQSLLEAENPATGVQTRLPGLERIASIFRLDAMERQALLIILAPELDPRYERIYAYLANDLTAKHPTLSLLLRLLCRTDEAKNELTVRLTSHSPLRLFRLIRFEDPDGQTPLMRRPLGLDPSVRNVLLGHGQLDDRLTPFCRLLPVPETPGTASDAVTEGLQKAVEQEQRFIVNLYGTSELQKRNRAASLAASFGYGLLIVNAARGAEHFEDTDTLLTLLFREALLSGTLLYFDALDTWIGHPDHLRSEAALLAALERFSWLTFFASGKAWHPAELPPSQHIVTLAFAPPRYPESVHLWKRYLSAVDADAAEKASEGLAQRFSFPEEEMEAIVRQLKTEQLFGRTVTPKLLYETCRQRIATDMEQLAQPVRTSRTLDDIVLPEEQKRQLESVISHYRHQFGVFEEWNFKKHYTSQGIGVLFAGAPGTGKTMAASILANSLGLDLYRIELSQVVSKYIGETEKNLARIFEAAAHSGVMLFFDEADAIFGKRTEVHDAHDRYANIEVSYLLQKIEEYDGLVVLASNFRKNIDDAFVRRMRFIIEFTLPDAAMREAIWRKVFPPGVPLETIDFAYLGEHFRLSGAHIRNIALSAAFLAKEAAGTVTMAHIIEGAKQEYRKIGENFRIPAAN